MEEGAWENNHGWDMWHTRWQNFFGAHKDACNSRLVLSQAHWVCGARCDQTVLHWRVLWMSWLHFSVLLLLLPILTSNLQVTIATHHWTSSSSCTLQRYHRIAPSSPRGTVWSHRSNRVTAFDTSKHIWSFDLCVSISIHSFSVTGTETEANVPVGFCLGLASAMGFTEAMSSSFAVSIDSVTYLSTPFTILTMSSNRDGTNTSILWRSSRLRTFMSKTGPNLVFL